MFTWFRELFKKNKKQQNDSFESNTIQTVNNTEIEKQVDIVVEKRISRCVNLLAYNDSLKYWQSVFKALAYAESSFKLNSRYIETGLGKDRVTGRQNTSEGLLQMSYQDALFHQCEFDWSIDSSKAEKDLSKTIFDIRRNVECGMIVLDKLIAKHKKLYFNDGHYWAVLKPENKRHKVFTSAFEKYMSAQQTAQVPTPTPVPVPAPAPAPTPAPVKKKLRVAFIEGHGDLDKKGNIDTGSTHYNKKTELDYTRQCTKLISEWEPLENVEVKCFIQYPSVKTCADKVIKWGADISIELHTNAFNQKAKGCQVNVLSNDPESLKIARKFSEMFCAKFNRVKRDTDGVVEMGRQERGIYNLSVVEPLKVAILVEPFFGDNKNDYVSVEEYVAFLKDFIESL